MRWLRSLFFTITLQKKSHIYAAVLMFTTIILSPATDAYSFDDDMCAAERYGSNVGCTAGDVSITGISVAPGTPTSCVGGSTFLADLDITVNFSQPNRYDIGIFLSNDGKDPTMLPTNGGSDNCSVGVLPTSFPFLDLDPNGGLDTCGDGNKNINVAPDTGSGVVRLTDVPVSCTTLAGSGGNLYIPFVVTWDNQASPSGDDCTSIADPVPGTPSKCNSPDVTNAVEVLYGTVNAVVLPYISKTNNRTSVSPGNSISYDVDIHNTTGQPLSGAVFTDPATANVNVSSVTCSSTGGATCPAVTVPAMQDILTGITIPDMPIDSAVTFTINAAVADPISPSHASTISNTAFVTIQGEFNSDTDTDDIIGAVFSDLSTSTKSVTDLNGGEADPGDVLRYTITLIETEGQQVIGATVTDDIPAGINNFTVVSIPTGSTDSSTGVGTGANGTGYLNINGINVAASGSELIEFDVTIPLSTTAGALIDNTATITNPGGPGATPIAPTVPVSPSAVPSTDNKQLYLDSTTMSRAKPTGTPAAITLTKNNPVSWDGTPVLQLDNTIESTSASLYLSDSTTQSQQVEVRMYCSSSPENYVTSGTYALGDIPAAPTLYKFNLTTLAGTFSFPSTCPTGDYWVLEVENQNNQDITLTPVTAASEFSRLNLDSSNVIYVVNLVFYDLPYTDPTSSIITSAAPNDVIYIRSVISDPFGSFDITDAIIEITDPLGANMLTPPPVSMPIVNDSGAATKTFEYAYTLPATPAAGNWNVRVTGLEGDEGLVTDDLVGAFTVESLDMELSKIVDTAAPTELGNVVYTLTISNLDASLTATGIQVTDLLPAGLSYVSDTAPLPTTYDDATGIWDIGALTPASNISMTLTAQTQFGSAGSTITNTTTITAYDQYDDDTSNNSASIDVVPVAAPNLTILKSADRATVNSGEIITYTLVVQNTGSGTATIVELYDNLSSYVDMILDFDTGTPPVEAFDFTPQTSGLTLGVPAYTYSGLDIIRWDITMGGTFAASSQFTLRFKVQVK